MASWLKYFFLFLFCLFFIYFYFLDIDFVGRVMAEINFRTDTFSIPKNSILAMRNDADIHLPLKMLFVVVIIACS